MMDNPTYGVTTLNVPPARTERGAISSHNGQTEDSTQQSREREQLEANSHTESAVERELVNPLYGSAQDCMQTHTLGDCSEREVNNPIYGYAMELDCLTPSSPCVNEIGNRNSNKMIHQHSCPERSQFDTESIRPRRHSSYENYNGWSMKHTSLHKLHTPITKQGGRTGKKPAVLPRKISTAKSVGKSTEVQRPVAIPRKTVSATSEKLAVECTQVERPAGARQEAGHNGVDYSKLCHFHSGQGTVPNMDTGDYCCTIVDSSGQAISTEHCCRGSNTGISKSVIYGSGLSLASCKLSPI